MSSIAFFPCTFTPVVNVAKDVAVSLDLKFYDDAALFEETGQKYGVSTERLEKAMYGKTSVFNQFTLEREKSINQLKAVLAEKLASSEDFLFYGFMTALFSDRVAHVLRVLLVGTRETRMANGVTDGLTEKEVKKRLRADDVKAYNFVDFLCGKAAYDSTLYDLVVPVELKSRDELGEIVSHYFHKTSVLRTERSQQAVMDMQLETEVEAALLLKGHRLEVSADGEDVRLTVHNSVLNFDKLVKELDEIVKRVKGVSKVVVDKGYDYNDPIYRRQKFNLPSKVLFVDDEKDFVQTVSERLISRNVGTYGVYNGDDALTIIKEDRPDVMVLDLKMPGIYGIEVLRQAKEIAPEVEVIILTGHGSNQDMVDCMELGAFAYINKPVDIEELSSTIKAANEKAMAREPKAS